MGLVTSLRCLCFLSKISSISILFSTLLVSLNLNCRTLDRLLNLSKLTLGFGDYLSVCLTVSRSFRKLADDYFAIILSYDFLGLSKLIATMLFKYGF